MTKGNVNVVLAHGAWADGSSWNEVITPLQRQGISVIAAPLPLTSLSDDVAALDRAIARTQGPVVLTAHAYAGAVISAAKSAQIEALAYIAALMPDEGETVADVFYREAPHADAPQLVPDADGFIWMPDSGFKSAFAQHATAQRLALLAATQRPINVACIHEKAPKPLWRSRPSWFLIAEEDRMINPKTEHFMAERMAAKVRSEIVDHTPLVTAPRKVVDTILDAVRSVRG
ncbi:alpha/beta hydrolase [Hyphomicrobium sp.]|uniref:alpha/beta hydrolase n=1 Tax=Hyphomicrobium sp. TaxID=82 RepID=UPI000FA4D892|nr:alpha/beta hydrolase [Hyphomicrobium sp.]RUP07721.1 MAG: alpha/beta hydrolase [Hyphomicrobium sp.]